MANKPTREQQEERIAYTLRKLRQAFYPSDVTKAIRKKFGLGAKAASELLKKAQKQLLADRQARTQENELDISVDVYKEAIVRGWLTGNLKAVIAANTNLAKLLGLDKIHNQQEVDESQVDELTKSFLEKSAPALIEGDTSQDDA